MKKNYDIRKIKELLAKSNIKVFGIRYHEKASEIYIDIEFFYPDTKQGWMGSIPIEYRRTGVSAQNEEEVVTLLKNTYRLMHPKNLKNWFNEQKKFWGNCNKKVTQSFFEVLKDFKWKCVHCELPKNPNWARRVQDLKEFGYTLTTDTKMHCEKCKKNTTHLILLPLPRGQQTGYEIIAPKLKERILKVLGNINAYENRVTHSLLPDHKFPEIRWDEKTMQSNPENMEPGEIKKKIQLLANQRNQQKRETCRKCYQTGKRGVLFGITFYYKGSEDWPNGVPRRGKAAEKGCEGCGWYDLQEWRRRLNDLIKKKKN